MATIIKSFADGTHWRGFAWKAVGVVCHLLLQKPNANGSSSSHSKYLECRLSLWKSGRIDELAEEAMCIQTHLLVRKAVVPQEKTPPDTVFSKLVNAGKIHSTIQYLAQDSAGGVLKKKD